MAFLGFNRQGGDRAGVEPLERNLLARLFAIAIGAIVDAADGGVDLGDQLALPVAGAQLNGAIRLRGGAICDIGVVLVFVLQGGQRFAPQCRP